MTSVTVSKNIAVNPDKVWQTISAGDGLEKWLPAIAQCKLEGSGAGAIRYCTLGNGAQLRERIVEVDHVARRFRYLIDEHPLPATNLMGTVEVRPGISGGTDISWSAAYDADEPHATELQGMFRDIYVGAIDGLAKHLSAG